MAGGCRRETTSKRKSTRQRVCVQERKSAHESERKHVAAYSKQKESMCKEEVKHVRDGKPKIRKAHVRWRQKCAKEQKSMCERESMSDKGREGRHTNDRKRPYARQRGNRLGQKEECARQRGKA